MITYDTLYNRDSTGRVRVWFMQQDGAQYRTISGLKDGKLTESGWSNAEPTNVGRANHRDAVEQATFEVEANYQYQLTRTYHRDEADIDTPIYFEPMLAQKYKKFTQGCVQPKLDGVRCIAKADGLWSREGRRFISTAHLEAQLAPLFEQFPDMILDGEMYNHDMHDDFQSIVGLVVTKKPEKLTPEKLAYIAQVVQLHVYDMPSHIGSFTERSQRVAQIIMEAGSSLESVKLVPTVNVYEPLVYDDLHDAFLAAGYEGSMWRCPNTVYEQKRSKSLQKRKDFDDAEFEVASIDEGDGNWAGAAKRVTCWLPGADRTGGPTKDNTFGAGIRGSYERGQALLNETHKIVTVRFFGWTTSEIPKPRFGVVTKFWGEARDA